MPSIAIVAGEASGDASGAALAKELLRICPDVKIWGAGGPRMREAGVELVSDFSWAGAIGIVESLKLVPRLLVELGKLKREMIERKPDVFVPIDFGAFNVKLGQFARGSGINTVYYFPPGSWRRRPRHHSSLLAASDKIITPFPWSAEILSNAGADAIFLGHPILDQVRPTVSREEFTKATDNTAILSLSKDELLPSCSSFDRLRMTGDEAGQHVIIGLLPGSRKHEIENILPAFIDASRIISQKSPEVAYVIAAGSDRAGSLINKVLKKHRADNYSVVKGQTHDVMAHSDVLLTCSGTATLEAMILGTPMIIVYRGSSLMKFEYLFRKAILEQFAGMPNIIAGREICPELLGDEATPKVIAEHALRLLLNPDEMNRMKTDLAAAKSSLGEPGGTARAAEIILEVVSKH